MTNTQDRIFIAYVFLVFFTNSIKEILPIGIWNFVDDLIFIFMLANVFLFRREILLLLSPVFYILCFFVFAYVIYGIVRENNLMAPLLYARYFKNFFLVFIIATLNPSCFDKTIKIVFWCLLLSVPMSFYQFKTADMSNASWWDEVGGVLGREGNSGTLSLLIVTYICYEYFKRIRDGVSTLGLYVLLAIPMLINETKIVFVLIPILFFIVLVTFGRAARNKLITIPPLFFIIAIFSDSLYLLFFDYSLLDAFNMDFIEEYFFVDEVYLRQEIDIGRFMRLIYAHEYITSVGWLTTLFGSGLGSVFYGQNAGVEGSVVSEFYVLRLHTGSRNQLYQLLIEFGYVGTLIFTSLIIFIWYKAVRRKTRTNENIMTLVAVPVFLFSLLYQPVIETKVILFLMVYSFLADEMLNRRVILKIKTSDFAQN